MPVRARHPLHQSPLFKLRSRGRLARIIGITPSELRQLTASGDSSYREFDIAKKNGGVRHVENPRRPLKLVQARLARLLARIEPPDFLFCPVKGRCYVANAAAHRGNRSVHCLDIKSFFPNTPRRRVYWFFRNVMQCEKDIAGTLAALSTYNDHLPTGSPLSPILAYLSYYDLWQRIDAYCLERDFKFTLYIDDVTLSGKRVTEADVWEVRKMIHAVGLRYHKRKRYIDRAAEVTGVIVKPDKVAAPFRQHRKAKAGRDALLGTPAEERDALKATITGIEGQIAQIGRFNRG